MLPHDNGLKLFHFLQGDYPHIFWVDVLICVCIMSPNRRPADRTLLSVSVLIASEPIDKLVDSKLDICLLFCSAPVLPLNLGDLSNQVD